MPSFYLKQPNGLYARFSTIPDDFTVMNLSREQALKHAQDDMGKKDGAEKIARADADEDAAEYDADAPAGLRRWQGAVDTVRMRHGMVTAEMRRVAGTEAAAPAAPPPRPVPRVKVTVGYVVAESLSGGRGKYLGATIRGGYTAGWWSESQAAAIRFLTKSRAAKIARNYGTLGVRTTRVVRLWRWV